MPKTNPPARQTKPTAEVVCDGIVALHFSITVEDMATWDPRNIYQFFSGIAQAREAIEKEKVQHGK